MTAASGQSCRCCLRSSFPYPSRIDITGRKTASNTVREACLRQKRSAGQNLFLHGFMGKTCRSKAAGSDPETGELRNLSANTGREHGICSRPFLLCLFWSPNQGIPLRSCSPGSSMAQERPLASLLFSAARISSALLRQYPAIRWCRLWSPLPCPAPRRFRFRWVCRKVLH